MKNSKIIAVLFSMSLMLGGCGQNEEIIESMPIEVSQSVSKELGTEAKELNNGETDYQKDAEIPRTLKMNATVKFCVDTPDNVEVRAANGYYVPGNKYFVVYGAYVDPSSEALHGVDITKIQSPSDVLEEMSEQFLWTSREGLIRAENYSMEIINKEEVTVNNWDMCRYEGNVILESGNKIDYNTAGFAAYTVIKDGYPVFFAVFDDPTDEEIADIVTIADKIAKTFREYSEE